MMNQELKIKVCGMKYLDNLKEVASLRPDYLGFIFFPKSPRNVDELIGEEVIAATQGITRVGVFVNADYDFITQKITEFGLGLLQLHGDEPVELCKQLKEDGHSIMKVFGVGESFDFSRLEPYKTYVDFFLFDTKGKDYGGNGVTFNWELLKEYDNEKPIFLSGGLGPKNIDAVKELSGISIHALDINSKFEDKPGVKNIDLLKEADFDKTRKLFKHGE